MHFELRANDNSTHKNSDGNSGLDYFLTFIIYRRARCTFKVTPGYAFRGRVYETSFVKFSYSFTLAISQLISDSKINNTGTRKKKILSTRRDKHFYTFLGSLNLNPGLDPLSQVRIPFITLKK